MSASRGDRELFHEGGRKRGPSSRRGAGLRGICKEAGAAGQGKKVEGHAPAPQAPDCDRAASVVESTCRASYAPLVAEALRDARPVCLLLPVRPALRYHPADALA